MFINYDCSNQTTNNILKISTLNKNDYGKLIFIDKLNMEYGIFLL